MKIITAYLTNNPCYIRNSKKTDKRDVAFQKSGPKKLMLHSVGTPQPDAEVFCKLWNKKTYYRACVHAFISAINGNVYQTLPWNYRGWHAGKAVGNNTCIGVEMCEPKYIRYTSGSKFTVTDKEKAIEQAKITYKSAVELFAYLCKELGLDPLKDITSHYEGYQAGIASNHADPRHLWKGLGLSYTMDGFRKDVKAAMAIPDPEPTTTTAVRYKVSGTGDGKLNVRKGAGTSYSVVGELKEQWEVKYYGKSKKVGTQTWYYVKKPSLSIEGWVNSKYLKKV